MELRNDHANYFVVVTQKQWSARIARIESAIHHNVLHPFSVYRVFAVTSDVTNTEKRSRTVVNQRESPGGNRCTWTQVLVRPKVKPSCQMLGRTKKCEVNVLIRSQLRKSDARLLT